MKWARRRLTMRMYPQVLIMFWMDQVQRLINQFKTVEKSKKDFSDQDDEIKPHPFLDIVLWNYWETR